MIACHVIRFRRTQNSAPEPGMAIVTEPGLYDATVIVDAKGQVIPRDSMWSYTLEPHNGTIVLPPTA